MTWIEYVGLTAVRDESGEIVDIEVSYPMDLRGQMLYQKHYFEEKEGELEEVAARYRQCRYRAQRVGNRIF